MIKQIHTKSFTPQEGGGECVAFMSQEFSSYIIGCPEDNFVVKCDVSISYIILELIYVSLFLRQLYSK